MNIDTFVDTYEGLEEEKIKMNYWITELNKIKKIK